MNLPEFPKPDVKYPQSGQSYKLDWLDGYSAVAVTDYSDQLIAILNELQQELDSYKNTSKPVEQVAALLKQQVKTTMTYKHP